MESRARVPATRTDMAGRWVGGEKFAGGYAAGLMVAR